MKNLVIALVSGGLMCCLGLSGCASSAKSEPKAESKPAQTSPAPAPAPAPAGMVRTAMALPTGDNATSVLLIERFMPAEVNAGQDWQYSYKVTNLTRNEVTNVVLRDNCSPLTVSSTSPQATGQSPSLAWNLGTFTGGQSKTVTVNGKATGTATVGSCATAEWAQTFCQQVAVVQPALKLDLVMQPNAIKCDPICGKATVTNTGSGSARNARVTVKLPEGFTTNDGKTGSITLDAGTLAPGASRSFDICGKVNATGNFCAAASATAEPALTAAAKDACTVVTAPALKITAECPTGGIVGRAGRNFTFKFTVSNTGNAPCSPTVTTPSVAGTQFVSADNGGTSGPTGVTWSLGQLAPGASKTVSVTVKAVSAGSFTASANAKCDCADQVSASCNVSTTGVPDIGTLVTDGDGVVLVGDAHTYTCEVQNQGMVPLTNVKMVVTLPEALSYISSASNPTVAGKKITFNFGTVPVGETRRFTFTAKANAAGEHLVIGETTCSELRTPVRDDELTNFVQ